MPFQVLRSTELLSTPITGYLQGLPLHCRHPASLCDLFDRCSDHFLSIPFTSTNLLRPLRLLRLSTYIHTFPIRCSPLLSDTEVTSSSELTYLRRAPVHWHDAKCWIVVSIIPHGTNSEKPPLYLLPTSAATSHRLANTTDDHR